MNRFAKGLAALVLAAGVSCVARGGQQALLDAAIDALRRGNLAAAQKSIDEGQSLTLQDPDGVWAWRFRFLQADAFLNARNLAKATEISKLPLPANSTNLSELQARSQYLQARIEYSQNRIAKALEIANQASALAPDGTELKLEIDGFAGQLGLQLGNWAESDARLDAVVAAAAAGNRDYVQSMALVSQGMGKFLRNRCDEALPSFERVISLKKLDGTTVYAKALNNSGMCYARLGLFDRALDAQRRAVKVLENRPGSVDYEQALGQLGTTYLHQGSARDGIGSIRRAFQVASDAKINADASLWAMNLAKAYIDLEEWDEADRFNEQAKRLAATTNPASATGAVRLSYTLEHGASIAAGRRNFDEAARLYRDVLAVKEAPPSVVWHAHRGLAEIAAARNQPAEAAREFEAALDVIEKTRAGLLRDDYKLSYLTELIAFYRDYVAELIERGSTQRALEVADSSRGRVLAERQRAAAPPRASVDALCRLAAQHHAALLSYWLTPRTSYLWIITGDGVRQVTLPPSSHIDVLVRDHQLAIGNALADPLATGHSAGDKLYQMLIAPAAALVKPDARIILVPDGSLHGINFETLPVDGPRRHYLIEDREIQIAPSLSGLTAVPVRRDEVPSTLIIGNPTPRLPEFPALKYARAEMTDVAGRFAADRVVTYEADRATPAAYRDARPERFAYVHFTAHATANRDSPLDSAVILSGTDESYKLYARDVAALPLSADLVTVSACRSAGERAYSGEGLVGFAWAFLRAGARRVVAGLWDVDDRSTADLMDRLYAGIAQGERPAAALRRAKLDLLQQGARPFAWGAFQLFTVVP
ncbi:MAG TPA: CHAT domain-containing protein [Vicinamibacterales bacterium]